MEYYWATKKNAILSRATTRNHWINSEALKKTIIFEHLLYVQHLLDVCAAQLFLKYEFHPVVSTIYIQELALDTD